MSSIQKFPKRLSTVLTGGECHDKHFTVKPLTNSLKCVHHDTLYIHCMTTVFIMKTWKLWWVGRQWRNFDIHPTPWPYVKVTVTVDNIWGYIIVDVCQSDTREWILSKWQYKTSDLCLVAEVLLHLFGS